MAVDTVAIAQEIYTVAKVTKDWIGWEYCKVIS
ncbi:hypothetical protein K144313037_p20550 (plasmid) [Clostridium tetani]|nr:hypothetical protein K144313037_p20550 [Clostridium tetani]BDR86105.1 hypothetical protein N071400001_07130 [Clostridium tetani]BEV19069.1 hypothetical protein K154301001_09240 [Clostridium tetani]